MTKVKGPRLTTSLKLALTGGSSDRLRFVLSALGSLVAALFVLAAVNVLLIDGSGYQSELLAQDGLHPGVVITLLGLSLPLFAFVGQCIRVGAPARDKRLAAFRMAGATSRDVGRIVVLETVLAAGVGAVLGSAAFAVGRAIVPNEPDIGGRLRFPTDVSLGPLVYLGVVVAVVVLASLGALLALRRTIVDPFGIQRHHAVRTPGWRPIVITAIVLFAAVPLTALAEYRFRDAAFAGASLIVFGFILLLIALGVTLATASLAQAVGRYVRRKTDRPALLLASARLEAQPFRASRSLGLVLVAVLVGSAVQQFRSIFLAETDSGDRFYADTFDLLDLALAAAVLFGVVGLFVGAAEGITERRRTLAALVAMGTPRQTIVRSVLAETLLPLAPGVALVAVVGVTLGLVFGGALGGGSFAVASFGSMAVLCVGTIVAATAVTALSLVFLPASTSPTELRAAA